MEKWNSQSLRDNPLEEIGAFFNKRAEIYNEVHLENVKIESKNAIASFLPGHTKTIIDFGIGTGLELAEIFRRFPNAEITGYDIAQDMLKKLMNTYPDKYINIKCQSYLDCSFGSNLYDAAVSVMTLHHYNHCTKINLYHKIYDCIKPGGVYIECDYMLSEKEHGNPQELEDFYFAEYERLKSEQGLNGDKQYHYDTPCTVANQINMLAKAGFTNIREVWRQGNTVIIKAEKE